MTAVHVEHEGRTYVLGRHVDAADRHDPRNLNFPAATATTLTKVDWTRTGGPLDQGQLGSCTGNALAGWMNTAPGYKAPAVLKTETDAVRYYSAATAIDPYPGTYPPTDTGSDGQSVCKAAMKSGELTGYTHALGIDHVLAALMLGPMIVGTEWTQGMFNVDSAGIVHPTGKVAGGHEYELSAYDPATKLLGFWNSWSASWGRGGRFWMHQTDFSKLLKAGGDATVPAR